MTPLFKITAYIQPGIHAGTDTEEEARREEKRGCLGTVQ